MPFEMTFYRKQSIDVTMSLKMFYRNDIISFVPLNFFHGSFNRIFMQ